MPHVDDQLQPVLREASQRLRAVFGDRLHRVVLYGSQARGDARPDSDVDLLVVLRGPYALYDEMRRLTRLQTELEEAHGCNLSLQPFSEVEYQNRDHAFMRNVHDDAVDLLPLA